MKSLNHRPEKRYNSRPLNLDPIPCTSEEPCKVCGGTSHPCYIQGEDLWCGAGKGDNAEAFSYIPKGYELCGVVPGSGQAVYKLTKAAQAIRGQADITLQESFDSESPEKVMREVDRILQIESEYRQECEGLMLARKIKWANWSQLKAIHHKKAQGSKAFAPLDHDDFLAQAPEQREWIVVGLISASTTILNFADGGVGKTLLSYDLCKSIASGIDWNGFRTKQGKVLIIQTDEPEIDTRERLNIAQFQDCPKGKVKIQTDWQFSQLRQLQNWIEKERPLFVLIDSLASADRASIAGSEWDAAYANNLYDLRNLSNTFGCTIMVLHHENKAGGARGSTAIRNNVSEVWRLRKGEKSENLKLTQRVLEIEKSRSGCIGAYQLELDPDDYSWKWQGDFGQDENESTSIAQRIQDYLTLNSDRKFELDELMAVHSLGGTSRESMRKYLERLRKKGIIESVFRNDSTGTHGGKRRYRLYFVQSKNQDIQSEVSVQDQNASNQDKVSTTLIGT